MLDDSFWPTLQGQKFWGAGYKSPRCFSMAYPALMSTSLVVTRWLSAPTLLHVFEKWPVDREALGLLTVKKQNTQNFYLRMVDKRCTCCYGNISDSCEIKKGSSLKTIISLSLKDTFCMLYCFLFNPQDLHLHNISSPCSGIWQRAARVFHSHVLVGILHTFLEGETLHVGIIRASQVKCQIFQVPGIR